MHDMMTNSSGVRMCRNCGGHGFDLSSECPGPVQLARPGWAPKPATPELMKVPDDYAAKRCEWSLQKPSPAVRQISGDLAYHTALNRWEAVEPYKEIAAALKIERGLTYRGTLSEEDKAELRKPATPEPPEWKVDRLVIDGVVVATAEMPERICSRPDYIPATVTNTGVGVGTVDSAAQSMTVTNPNTPKRGWLPHWKGDHRVMADGSIIYRPDREPSPLDRALSDFIAKRKAKRTNAEAQAEAAGFMTDPKAREIAEAQAEAFGRAFSLPLTFTARLGMKQP